jgi:hypothetical protein
MTVRTGYFAKTFRKGNERENAAEKAGAGTTFGSSGKTALEL